MSALARGTAVITWASLRWTSPTKRPNRSRRGSRGITEVLARGVELADPGLLDAAASAVADRVGSCNVVCANFGVMRFGPLEQTTADDSQWLLSVNVIGIANTVNTFLPLVRAADWPRHIALTSSVAALAPSPRQGAYVTTKFAITECGDVLRQELADNDIGVTRRDRARPASRCRATKIARW
jgi:NADP-dependent 3-hydroxy acid dehydrogenase YdfG